MKDRALSPLGNSVERLVPASPPFGRPRISRNAEFHDSIVASGAMTRTACEPRPPPMRFREGRSAVPGCASIPVTALECVTKSLPLPSRRAAHAQSPEAPSRRPRNNSDRQNKIALFRALLTERYADISDKAKTFFQASPARLAAFSQKEVCFAGKNPGGK